MTKEDQQLWALIGHYHDPYGYDDDRDEILALFTSRVKAEQYIRDSRLKSRSTRQWDARFKKRSLLAMYKDASVEEYMPEEYEVNPTL